VKYGDEDGLGGAERSGLRPPPSLSLLQLLLLGGGVGGISDIPPNMPATADNTNPHNKHTTQCYPVKTTFPLRLID